ncbi:MAG: hypothetical protein ABJE66_08565 [Deltaproteobacteria bacterium]
MRCILLVLVLALALAACTTHDEHHIEVSWTIDQYEPYPAETPVACPEGWRTAELVAIDPARPDVRHVDTFPCTAGFGTSTYLSADSYVSWIEIHDGDKLLASSIPETVPVTSFGPILTADIYIDAGYIEADWNPCASTDGAPEQLDVRLDVLHDGKFTAGEFVACSAGRAVSPALPPGTYSAMLSDGTFSTTLDDIVVEAPNKVTRLGRFPIGAN